MRKAPLLMLVIPALFSVSGLAGAQIHIRQPQLGVFGGFTKPTGEFKDETGNSWNAGALFKLRVTRTFDLRLDAMYSKLGSREVQFTDAFIKSASNVVLGSLLAELNLGPDSAQYPGDNAVSPYINAGPAMYRYTFSGTCTDVALACEGFVEDNEETKLGYNIGAGANVPFNGIPLFAEFRYHRFGTVFPLSQIKNTGTMITVSVGFKIR
jgi:opacity protein-like surface antigen